MDFAFIRLGNHATKVAAFTALLALFVIPAEQVRAQVLPGVLNYQGRLTELDGTPVDGTRTVVFGLYDLDVGGASLWTETQSVLVDAGVFSVQLGSVTPIDVDFSVQYWLEIEIDGDVMSERVALLPVPYAHFADQANEASEAALAASADHALQADHAATADSAVDADHASAADEATHAADADHALTADTASQADVATSADEAAHAAAADHATLADVATHSGEADHASTADQATSADYATEAGHASDADTLQGVDMSALEESEDIEAAIDNHEATMHSSLLKGSDLTEETTQGTTWTEIAAAAVAPGVVSDWVKVEVLLFTENLGSSTAMYSRYDIAVGEPGLEVSYQDGDHFYIAGADNTVGSILSTVILYYEPTAAEKTNGFNVLVSGYTFGSCQITAKTLLVWGQ